MTKTNAVRILESHHVAHEVHEYEYNDEEIDAISVAGKLHANPEEVFKTLVASGDKSGIVVFCIPGNAELQLKKAAQVSGNKRVEMVKTRELLGLTGYIRGGCSPIGMKKQYPTFIDETAQVFDRIYVSAGARGLQVHLAPDDLCAAAGAAYADLI